MQYKDYYQILGLDKTASADDIKKAYRKLARQYHPDISKEPDAADRMAEINEAHTVLGDPEKRAVYDTVGAQAWAAGARSGDDVRPPPGWSSGFDFGGGFDGQAAGGGEGFRAHFGAGDYSEFFENLFGRSAQAHAARSARSHGPQRGQDQHASITLDLADAYHGAERQIRLHGVRLNAQGQPEPHERTLQVKIPKGVKEGQLIRLAGQGHPGLNGGAAGDVLLQVQFRHDPRWQVDGRDVTQTLRVAPWEAALGADVAITTPGGDTVTLALPAGSGHGRKLRLKGRGIPSASAPGDLYLQLHIAVPSAVTDEQKAAWAALRDAYPGFNPRAA